MISCTIATVILITNFKVDTVVETVTVQDDKVIFITGELFSFNFKGVIRKRGLYTIKNLEFTKGQLEEPVILHVKDDKYILIRDEKTIEIFSSAGKLVTSKSIDQVLEGDRIISSCVSDLNNDFCDEILLILGDMDKEYGNSLIVYSFDDELQRIFYQSLESMNPWKIQTSDVDGDKSREIAIAMFKETKFHPVMANRPYLYDWIDNRIFPKWRGSRLSKPFDDYIFQDIDDDGADELISIETLQDGYKVVNSYKWKGFGFEGLAESNEYEDIMAIERSVTNHKQIYINVKEKNVNKWVTLEYDGKRFLEEAKIEN